MDQQLFIKMALANWDIQINRLEKMFNSFTDEELQLQVAPGKNRVIYLLGHFVAYHDMLGESLGLAPRKYAHLDEDFLKNADSVDANMPDAAYLRQAWTEIHEKLTGLFNGLSPEDWFKRHQLVSEEDFAKDLTRNRLNMIMNRSAHVAYHAGQVKLCNK